TTATTNDTLKIRANMRTLVTVPPNAAGPEKWPRSWRGPGGALKGAAGNVRAESGGGKTPLPGSPHAALSGFRMIQNDSELLRAPRDRGHRGSDRHSISLPPLEMPINSFQGWRMKCGRSSP